MNVWKLHFKIINTNIWIQNMTSTKYAASRISGLFCLKHFSYTC